MVAYLNSCWPLVENMTGFHIFKISELYRSFFSNICFAVTAASWVLLHFKAPDSLLCLFTLLCTEYFQLGSEQLFLYDRLLNGYKLWSQYTRSFGICYIHLYVAPCDVCRYTKLPKGTIGKGRVSSWRTSSKVCRWNFGMTRSQKTCLWVTM